MKLHNKLFFASKLQSPYLVSVLGFSSHRKRHRMLLVYELMPNGNLQNALLKTKRVELLEWRRRYDVFLDIAKGLEYLHSLDTPVIHGDIKPSNILLDHFFKAKIGDIGLARVKSESQNQCEITVVDDGGGLEVKKDGNGVEDCGSVVEETESVTTFEDFSGAVVGQSPSPESVLRVENSVASPDPETKTGSVFQDKD
uniref:non-specific serine/threonine protein kinase n=1 Tax=Quercus lobata TaxID=97700 RepID=A0A7N2MFG9_QUELO